ncbi:MAG: cell wall-active antibiotics response protein LiaF [Defluviitaleaceae bacterium]|nr:cell wall-active antibiotics response protein LiaF [Defluviitaleaceae bacterium]
MNKIKELLKRQYTKSEALGILLSIAAVGFVIDILLRRFSVLLLALAIFLIITGYQQFKQKNTFTAYFLIAIGSSFLLFTLFTSFSFSLLVATLVIYYSYQLFRSSAHKSNINVNIQPNPMGTRPYVQVDPYFKNKLVGEYRHFEQDYAIEDINLQTGFGDVQIDLSDRIIPQGETVVLIRGMVGNIYLNVPSDVGLSVQLSLLCGKITLLEDGKTAFNVTQKYQSVDYQETSRKIKIVISLFVGDIEVKHR